MIPGVDASRPFARLRRPETYSVRINKSDTILFPYSNVEEHHEQLPHHRCDFRFLWRPAGLADPRMPDRAFPQDTVDAICAPDDPHGFFRYEDRMDAGEDFSHIYPDVVREQGEDVAPIFAYYIEHYGDALPRMLPGMEDLLRDLKRHGYGVWGLTNWSHETIHIAFEKFPQIGELLQDTVVSGIEKMHKPNADIYELALQRFGLEAGHCVFFDDTAKNIVGANEVGIHGLLFDNALQARESLASLGVRL